MSRVSRAAAAAACLLVACGSGEPPGRVLVVGIDGATLRVAQPLLDQGRLPHLASLAAAGVHGPLRAHFPLVSPRIWTSIATGKLPERHGILGFARERDGRMQLYTGADRKTHALWNIASRAGLEVVVVNWWSTYPVEQVRGVIVSDHLVPLEVAGRERMMGVEPRAERERVVVHPASRQQRALALLEERSPLTSVGDPFAEAAGFAHWVRPERLSPRYWNDNAVTRIALELEAELHPDLMMVFLPGIDRICHVLWGNLEPPERLPDYLRGTAEERAVGAEAIYRYYEFTDALIGALLERYGEEDLILVVSDHGFELGISMLSLTGNHHTPRARDGVIFARGPGIAPVASTRRTTVNDVTPTILAWLGLPVGRDMDGRPADFLHGRRLRWLASWDTQPIVRVETADSGAEGEILGQLEALGYLEREDPR